MKKFVSVFLIAVLYTVNSLAAGTSRLSQTTNDVDRTVGQVRTSHKNNPVSSESTNNKAVSSRVATREREGNKTARTKTEAVVSRAAVSQNTENKNRTSQDVIDRKSRAGNAFNDVNTRKQFSEVKARASVPDVVTRTVKQDTQESIKPSKTVQARASISNLFGTTKKATITPTAESIATAKDVLEKTADLNSTCQQQYNECMDQFCAVVDANQKRCSCSSNLAKYAKVEKAVEDANSELNEVAQRIRYIGLSADEIRAIMSETEAETELSGTKDTSETRSMLDDIAELIQDPSITSSKNSASMSSTTNLMDMDLDFSSSSADMFDLSFFGGDNSKSISNLRGKDLYDEATKRCKNVLTQCKDAGGTETQITGNYDLAIDKDCIAYEQGLTKLNTTLVSNVRSANLMLQKARLSVLQNKNQYDIKGCVAALNTCMTDDMVCGENYYKCIDPTKKYINENGEVIFGQDISQVTKSMIDYDNSKINAEFIKNSDGKTACSATDGTCVVRYLLTKMGTGETVKDGGLCRAVLDKCQDFTYIASGKNNKKYNPYNDVVVNYIQRAMVNIQSAQYKIISEYASTCLEDISECYNQQLSQINTWTTTVNVSNVRNVMAGALRNIALTCSRAVFANDTSMSGKNDSEYIEKVSEIFYQSLLCPENSTYTATECTNKASGCVNTHCLCNEDYEVWGGACYLKCSNDSSRDEYGTCTTND
ncbi:MAG: hypothetical protein MJ156_02860 [Alphaproteobacteria bacterium]|nr:hypothetical protein [Alphaproteobacteria bacterium]